LNNYFTSEYNFPFPFQWSDFPQFNSNKSLDTAYKICQWLSKKHYENFPVASFVIPRKIRKHFYSIYAIARYADDIADEKLYINISERITALDNLEYYIDNIHYEQIEDYPILIALRNTINEMQLPTEPFAKLLTAFQRDLVFQQPDTFKDLLTYCEYSANPIGELILRLFNEYNDETAYYSDKITTALQLINLWQDLSVDLHNHRCYLPAELFNEYARALEENIYSELEGEEQRAFASYIKTGMRQMFNELFQETEKMLSEGKNLVNLIKNKRLQFEIKLIVKSGEKMLEKEKLMNYFLTFFRPSITKRDYFGIFRNSILWKS